MRLLIVTLLFICAHASPQYVKTAGVKGGHSGHGYQYQGGENFISHQNSYGAYSTRTNLTEPVNYETGVCYIEVPTISLVRDPTHVPPGNGSTPSLSRIRTCCKGYIRNIHNFRICDPVCTNECVNGLCTAPETCSCFPDHVKNLAGFCIPTCPIGCQNGYCSGGECICKEGYKLDSESKFCVPYCRQNCGGVGFGNCTAPDTCECSNGFASTRDGSCKPVCDRCRNGDCTGPNECLCHPGYKWNHNGDCEPQCPTPCTPPSRCVAPNVCEPLNPTTTTLRSLYGQPQNYNTNTQDPTRVPNGQHSQYPNSYPGNQPPDYPGNQQSINPGHQQSNYPGNQQPDYPGNQQSSNPGNQQSNYPDSQRSYYPGPQPNPGIQQNNPYNHPGSRQSYQPGYPQSNYTGYQQPNYRDSQYYPGNQLSNYTGNPQNRPSGQPSSYPGQRPLNIPDGQPIYTHIPSNQPSLYPDSQHGNPDQRPRPENQTPNSTQPNAGANYSNSKYYPGTYYGDLHRPGYPSNQYYPDQQYRPASYSSNQLPSPTESPNHAEPYYPNSQYYPGQQNNPYDQNRYQNRPQPDQHQYPGSYNPSNPQRVEYQQIFPDSQSSAVEMLCSRPCINGTCVARDTCSCNTGYVPINSDTSRCEPYCTGCTNGVCVSPYVCACNPGYYKDFSVKGRSSCIRRNRRSLDETFAPVNVADLLVFEIPDDYID